MNFIKSIFLFAVIQIKLLVRNKRAAVFGLLLSIAYLVVGTQILVVTFGNRISIGVYSRRVSVVNEVKKVMTKAGIKTIRYDNYREGLAALKSGDISSFVSLVDSTPPRLILTLSGKNPMLDNQIATLLLAVTPKLTSGAAGRPAPVKLVVNNIQVSPTSIISFMTASLLPFLIIHLALTYCGQFWVNDWESGRLFTLLFTPVRREAIIIGRSLGSAFLMVVNLIISLAVCRYFVRWNIPANIPLWTLIIFIQIFAGIGLNFFFAALCKKFVLFLNVIVVMIFLLSFISGVFTPAETLPLWEQFIAKLTPTFYAVRSMRAVMLGATKIIPKDLFIIIIWGVAFYIGGYFLLTKTSINDTNRG